MSGTAQPVSSKVGTSQVGTLKVLSTLGVKGVLEVLLPRFEKEAGVKVDASFDPTAMLVKRIAAGETGDVALLTSEAVDTLMASGVLAKGSRVDLARSQVGLAVPKGAARPDISSTAAVTALLKATPSIAYSKAGASGIFFAGVLDRLGLRQMVDAKATVIPAGFTGELLKDGRAALAVQQVSELMAVPDVDILGPLPPEIQDDLIFSGGIFASGNVERARQFLGAISGPATAGLYRAKGLYEI